jgi:transcriptional regulator with XRE-family HTH domain
MHNFPSTLKTLREERNLSQQTVANNIGISQQAYGLYERGKREPNLETLVKLSYYFKTSVDFLLGIVYSVADPKYDEIHEKLDFGKHKHLGMTTAFPKVLAEAVRSTATGTEQRDIFKDIRKQPQESDCEKL